MLHDIHHDSLYRYWHWATMITGAARALKPRYFRVTNNRPSTACLRRFLFTGAISFSAALRLLPPCRFRSVSASLYRRFTTPACHAGNFTPCRFVTKELLYRYGHTVRPLSYTYLRLPRASTMSRFLDNAESDEIYIARDLILDRGRYREHY